MRGGVSFSLMAMDEDDLVLWLGGSKTGAGTGPSASTKSAPKLVDRGVQFPMSRCAAAETSRPSTSASALITRFRETPTRNSPVMSLLNTNLPAKEKDWDKEVIVSGLLVRHWALYASDSCIIEAWYIWH